MEPVIVKSEMSSDSEPILLFYVDENGGNEERVLTTVDSIQHQVPMMQEQHIYLQQSDLHNLQNAQIYTTEEEMATDEACPDGWEDIDIKRLLVFYVDNKDSFVNGATKKNVLWSVACKTILSGKTTEACELKLCEIKAKYAEVLLEQMQGVSLITWPYFHMAHSAFNDDADVLAALEETEAIHTIQAEAVDSEIILPDQVETPPEPTVQENTIKINEVKNSVVLTKHNRNCDPKIELMLKLYLKYKNRSKNIQKDYWQKGLWHTITREMGETDPEYWSKRFLNFKQHYLRLLDKRKETGSDQVTWPYFELYEAIFRGDKDFQKKYNSQFTLNTKPQPEDKVEKRLRWNDTERMVLVKYHFDSLNEFLDPTIPDQFLWTEISRILDKTPDSCKTTYNTLREEHLDKYIAGDYDIKTRLPMAILFDNIISREAQSEIANFKVQYTEKWDTSKVDTLVNFVHNNINVFKDTMGYYVCWAALAKTLEKSISSCVKQWRDLKTLYHSILEEKKENPDSQLEWPYIDLFDRIFDFGMDEELLLGYEINLKRNKEISNYLGIDNKSEDDENPEDDDITDKDYVAKGYKPHSKKEGDRKAIKILEFYHANQNDFENKRKGDLWEELAKDIGISAQQCAHRFRNLKQVYKQYVQREIHKPEMPIVWPYYQLCKKVFGYRNFKKRAREVPTHVVEEWTPDDIKALIKFIHSDLGSIGETPDPVAFSELAKNLKKTIASCRNKFMEMRKSYRKLKTMKSRNPSVKVTWKYFQAFDAIYNGNNVDVDNIDEMMEVDEQKEAGDEDYECIIVLPEGGDVSDLPKTKPLEQNGAKKPTKLTRWNKISKRQLLIQYLNYLKAHKGEVISGKEMWTEIAEKLKNKTPLSCKKTYALMKSLRLTTTADLDKLPKDVVEDFELIDQIIDMKPKFKKVAKKTTDDAEKVYKDFELPEDVIKNALEGYLQKIEDFIDPRFEKKYAWMELSKKVNESLNKVFHKVNLLMQMYRKGEEVPFNDLVKEIVEKEDLIRSKLEKVVDGNSDDTVIWSDDEKEQLLVWYLANLDKFKNPKFVRKYLWLEVSNLLNKSALSCSKTMSEIRTQYRTLVRETPDELNNWRFHELCQKIYGTGKPKT